jgi:hypothetical protein
LKPPAGDFMLGKMKITQLTAALTVFICLGCGNDLNDQEKVQAVFDNFQPTIAKIIEAGIAAKSSSAQGANISPVVRNGDKQGTFTVGGKVAQSSGLNQNLDLWVQLDGPYSDTGEIFYATDNTSDATKLQFDVQIQNQPTDNFMSGTLAGGLTVSGDVDGSATLNLRFATDLADDDNAPTVICSHVTGSVVTPNATKDLDFLLPVDTSQLGQAQIDKCQAYVP